MNHFSRPLIVLLMVMTSALAAQEKHVCAIRWKMGGALPPAAGQAVAPGVAGPVAGVHNGVLLVAGGANFPDAMPWLGGKKKYYDEGTVFVRNRIGGLVVQKDFRLPYPLAYSANCSTPQGVIAAGGENAEGLSGRVWLLQWNANEGSVGATELPSLPVALTNAAATAHDGAVYVAGGETETAVSDRFFVLRLRNKGEGWKELPPVPKPLSHAVMVAQTDGHQTGLYLLGGRRRNSGDTSSLYATVYRFDPATAQWAEKKPLPFPLSAGTGTATGDRAILLFGGDKGKTFHRAERLIAAIGSERDSLKRQELNRQKIRVQSTHPGFYRGVLRYDATRDEWCEIGVIPYAVPVTTTAIAWGNGVVIPSGEIRAGVRTPGILTGRFSYCKAPCKNN